MEVDGVVAHSAGEAHAPLGILGAVSCVQQGAHRHNFVVDVSWKKRDMGNTEFNRMQGWSCIKRDF